MQRFRTLVFKRAYALVAEGQLSWSEALRISWDRYRNWRDISAKELQESIDRFDYHYERTDDGRVRRIWLLERARIRATFEKFPFLRSRVKNHKYFTR